MIDALTDPALSIPRKEPRPLQEILREGHEAHMKRVDQEGWLKDLLARADALVIEEPTQAATVHPPAGAMVTPKSKAPVKKKGAQRGRTQSN